MEEINQNKNIKKIHEIVANINYENIPDIDPKCPVCGSTKVYGMSRVVGYFSIIENWNSSKRAELKRRQKGNYWFIEE